MVGMPIRISNTTASTRPSLVTGPRTISAMTKLTGFILVSRRSSKKLFIIRKSAKARGSSFQFLFFHSSKTLSTAPFKMDRESIRLE